MRLKISEDEFWTRFSNSSLTTISVSTRQSDDDIVNLESAKCGFGLTTNDWDNNAG